MRKVKSIRIVGKAKEGEPVLIGQDVKVIAILEDGDMIDISNPISDLEICCDICGIVQAKCRWLVSEIDLEGVMLKEREENPDEIIL